MKRIYAFVLGLVALALLFAGPALAITVDLAAEKVDVTMPNTGEIIPMWVYQVTADPDGAVVPGDVLTIQAEAGDSLTINLTNNLNQGPGLVEPTSIVIPGQRATETNAMVPTWTDGTTVPRGADITKRVRSFTHEVGAGATGTYSWASLVAGTFLVQSGTHPQVQIPMGLYLVLEVDDTGQAGAEIHGEAYDSEQVLLFSEIDPVLNNAVATNNYGPGQAVTSTINYDPKYFLLNGTPYTQAGDVTVTGTPGDDILVRFLNAGLQTRVPQLQGAYMTLLAEDGHPVPFAKDVNSLVLPAAKSFDVLIQNAQTPVPVFDRRLAHSTAVSQAVPPSTLIQPNGGEILPVGQIFNVQWTAFPDAAFYRLRYSVDGGTNWLFIDRVDGATSYNWTVPDNPSANVLFRVTAHGAGGGFLDRDESDAPFTIVAGALLQPNGGEVLTPGQIFNVQWTAFANAAFYRLRYSVDGGTNWLFIDRVDGATSYNWTVPNENSANVLFRVTAHAGDGSFLTRDESDAPFSIGAALLQPNGGEVLTVGQIFNVQWTAFPDAAFYRLRYSVDGGTNWLFIDRVDGATSYNWTVPDENSANVLFRVTAHGAGGGFLDRDESDAAFTISP